MDGFDSSVGVIVLGATNRGDVLDPALLRPGRFDRRVAVQPPDGQGREMILRVHTRSVPLADDVDLTRIAQSTPGMVGADLANLVNEAALLAARRGHKLVQRSDFTDALERGMVQRWGMSEEVGFVTVARQDGQSLLLPGSEPASEATQELVDAEVRRIVEEEHRAVTALLTDNRHRLEALAEALLERETLDEVDAYAVAEITREAVPAAP